MRFEGVLQAPNGQKGKLEVSMAKESCSYDLRPAMAMAERGKNEEDNGRGKKMKVRDMAPS